MCGMCVVALRSKSWDLIARIENVWQVFWLSSIRKDVFPPIYIIYIYIDSDIVSFPKVKDYSCRNSSGFAPDSLTPDFKCKCMHFHLLDQKQCCKNALSGFFSTFACVL